MAHVLVAYQDRDLRDTLDEALTQTGHTITKVSDGALALAALWVARWPMVALLEGNLDAPGAYDILSLAAAENETATPRLARHQYVVMTTRALERGRDDMIRWLGQLRANVLFMPVDLYDVLDAVGEAEQRLLLQPDDIPLAPAWPARAGALVSPNLAPRR